MGTGTCEVDRPSPTGLHGQTLYESMSLTFARDFADRRRPALRSWPLAMRCSNPEELR